MTTNPILLIQDDVWFGSESLVDKLKFTLPDYKILVTSRFSFPGFDFTYSLKPLKEDDAMNLFHHSAFLQNGNPYIPDDLVNKVMKSCKGLPLGLEVVGRLLYGQPVAIWQNRVKQRSKGLSIFHSSVDLLSCLQSSLDALDNKVGLKDCYQDLGSFPEDHRIPATVLIYMWVEQYKLDEDDDAIVNLHELPTRNLVNLVVMRKDASEADGYYNDHFVMQHDLLRELAIYQSSLDPVEKRKSWGNIQAPEVEVLVLNFRTKNYTLPVFMEKMDKLKAFKNSTNKTSNIFPNLLEIDIDYCDDLLELTDGLCDLVQLMKLSITNCHMLCALPHAGKLESAKTNILY
ncbi:hypothetical protein CRYUN_Cryun15aG0125900 [Craigia yunnanensis]